MPIMPDISGPRSHSHSQKNMGHDEAVVTQNSVKAPSPPKDQPAIYPCFDWSTVQAYYGPGVLPPAFFNPGIAPGHAPPPYVWGPQTMPPAAFGKSYAAIYPHAGGFLHPLMPLVVNPLSAEPAKSGNSKDNSLNKKLKEIDGSAVSSGNSEKTSGDHSLEGSSDGNNPKVSGTPKKRSLDDRTTSETCGESGRLPALSSVRIPDTMMKPCVSTGSDFKVSGATSTEWPAKDDKESKRERRKQSNRESARRSRLRKQAETEELARRVELLTAENTSLRSEISRLTESSQKLRMENSALMEKLADGTSDQAQEASAGHQTTPTAPSSARVVKNFLWMMDGEGASRGGSGSSSRRRDHGAPMLRQLLSSGPLAADAVAAS
ncbi:bZIP transcription factor1 [Zea mays]|uniref:BZIP transcription factor1 n=4 Tax=Zea mays TaxID=4577 RepID=A0A1D6NGU9_MAIZE|nr:bZIP transcription factor1 [Zea mays]